MAAEYFIARLGKAPSGKDVFAVTKFEGSDQPTAEYFVAWDKRTDKMYCDCPNARRGQHIDDKHGRAIRDWLAAGEPTTPVSIAAPGKPQRAVPYQDPEDDIPF